MPRFFIFVLSTMASTMLLAPAYASDTNQERPAAEDVDASGDPAPGREVAKGILPQLAVALRVPEGMRLYDPEGPRLPDEPIEYKRVFPLGGQEVINRGYALPLPIGISLIGVSNVQDQSITDLRVALGKGEVPPEDTELKAVPFATVASNSDTQSVQIKADLWVLPFLNVFASIGRVTGEVDITLNIDLTDAEICVPDPRPPGPGNPDRPPVCLESELTGSVLLPVKPQVDRTSATLGFTGAYSIGKWFVSLNGSYTDTTGEKSSDISSVSAGLRAGRRLVYGRGNLLTPYLGISYADIDTRVQGTTGLDDAFPDGDSLDVRYDIQLDNVDKYAGVLGLAMGFTNGLGVQFEWNKSARSERLLLSGMARF